MGSYVQVSVYLSCLSFVIYIYSSFIITIGVIDHLLFFLLISCALFGILLRFRLPRPLDSTVTSIFGSDWGAYKYLPNSSQINDAYMMKVVAHRSCGLDAPENSLSAIKKIHKEGITAVEFDVMLTADNVAIVFHDTTLYRMTDVNKIVAETNFEEIKNLDISVKHPFKSNFEGEKIPTLEEYTKYCLDNQIRMFMDLKDDQINLCEKINSLFLQYPKLYGLAVVSSFNPFIIYRIRSKDPKIACSLAWRPYFYSHEDFNEANGPTHTRTSNLFYLLCLRLLNIIHEWFLWTFGYYILGLSALLLHKDMISRDNIHYWTKRGIRVIAWSVNLPTEKHYFEKILEITYLTDTVINS